MNTPAHIIMAAAVFAKPDQPKRNTAALVGGLLPDASLYTLAGWHLFVLGTPPQTVFDEYYFSDAWQSIFAIDNSFILWGMVLALGLWFKITWLWVLAGAALLHIGFDFPLHHDDGRMHFWPVSDWIFQSPVSYWDRKHYGGFVGPIETGLCLILLVILWRRFAGWFARVLIAAAGIFQIAPVFIWLFMFSG